MWSVLSARDAQPVAAAQLIVMGASSLDSVKRLVFGSVSTKVMHESDCDVLS